MVIWTRSLLIVVRATLCANTAGAQAEGYPVATLEQATITVINGLSIDRCHGLNEQALQSEYQWALDMAKLCVGGPEGMRGEPQWWVYGIEFQRHAGRVARYWGFSERALADYETAIEYVQACVSLPEDAKATQKPATADDFVAEWTHCILEDIANTYCAMGAYREAEALSKLIIEKERLGGCHNHPTQRYRIAEIAQRERRFGEAAARQRFAVQEEEQYHVRRFLVRHPDLVGDDVGRSWSDVVRDADAQRALEKPNRDDFTATTPLRTAYYRLARACRLAGHLDEAATALETAALTPWVRIGPYRERQDLYVDRERAWLLLETGDADEALARANACLDEHVMSQGERVELLDLASRALERLGESRASLGKLKEAIAIVETRRANLVEDENKQFFIAGYADLYRRALDLTVRIHEESGTDATEEAFEWSERVKARAMLDAINRYDRRMGRAIATGNVEEMHRVRDRARDVVSVEVLRKNRPWPADCALLEYTYGSEVGRRSSDQAGSAPAGPGNGARAVYLWVVTARGEALQRLNVVAAEVEQKCAELADALAPDHRRDEAWVEPARWLHQHLVAPALPELTGIKRLVIVGDGKLRSVPFEVFLATGDAGPGRSVRRHLIEDYAIAYAPSATLLDTISRRPSPERWDCALWAFASTRFKNTDTGPPAKPTSPARAYEAILRSARSSPLDDLLHTKDEVESIKERFPSGPVELFVDRPYMKDHLLKASRDGTLRSIRFLHFATHAVADPDRPYLSGLVLCPPYPSAERGSANAARPKRRGAPGAREADEGNASAGYTWTWRKRAVQRPERFTVGELTDLDLRSELVVLSACRSLGEASVDGDWVCGLARAFLIAGSSGVLCTTTDTGDRTASSFVPGFYYALLTGGAATTQRVDVPRALQEIKCSLLGSPMYGHPSVWAPWVYYGRVSAESD